MRRVFSREKEWKIAAATRAIRRCSTRRIFGWEEESDEEREDIIPRGGKMARQRKKRFPARGPSVDGWVMDEGRFWEGSPNFFG